MHLLALLGALLLASLPALAQDTTVSAGPLFQAVEPYVTAVVSAAVTALLAWLTATIAKWTGVAIEAKSRDALQTALENAAGLVIAKGGATLDEVRVDVRHPTLKAGVEYVQAAVPDALKRFGLGEDALREKLVAKVGVLVAKGGAQALPAPFRR
jgi:hypothetical protein